MAFAWCDLPYLALWRWQNNDPSQSSQIVQGVYDQVRLRLGPGGIQAI